jgi:hypothetical protein
LRSRIKFKSLRFIIQDFGELNTSESAETRGGGRGRDRAGAEKLATGRERDQAEAKYKNE